MNFNFIDVSSSFVNMVQKDVPNQAVTPADTKDGRSQVFAEKLKKTLEKSNGQPEKSKGSVDDSPTVKAKIEEPVIQDQETMVSFLLEKLNKSNGLEFISSLKSVFLMLSKGDLKNISIDAEGLEALKKMLLKAGFKDTDVNELIVELETMLEEDTDTGQLVLADFMDKLFELPLDNEIEIDHEIDHEIHPEMFIETSALPFIESLLTSMAVPDDQVQQILTASDKGEQGISLDVLLEKLQQLQKKSFYTHQEFKTPDGDNNFKHLIKQLDLDTNKTSPSAFTLDDFVAAIENLKNKKVSKLGQNDPALQAEQAKALHKTEQPVDLLKTLFKGMEIKNDNSEKHLFSFSKTQLATSSDFSVNAEKAVSHLFDDKQAKNLKNKTIKGGSAKDTLIQSKLIQSSVVNDVSKEAIVESKSSDKQIKSKLISTTDQPQVSLSESKPGESITDLNHLKSKASFKNLPAYVTNQVGKSIVRAASQGENVLKIQLKPSELGRLTMTIDNSGNSMKVSIITDTHAAKEILTSNISELRTVLSNSGVNLERFDVDMNSGFKQSMADAKNPAGNKGKQHRNRDNMSMEGITGEEMNDPSGLLNALNQDGSLHFVA